MPNPPLRRSRENPVVGGVCAGIADHLGIDRLFVRLVVLILSVTTSSWTVGILYVLFVVMVPQAPERAPESGPPGEGYGYP